MIIPSRIHNSQGYAVANHQAPVNRGPKVSYLERISNSYQSAIKNFVIYLRRHRWKITAMVLGTFLAEPWSVLKAGVLKICNWKKHFNFYNMNPKTLSTAQMSQTPILLIHGNYHDQSAWLSMGKVLKNVGPVYTVNLPGGYITQRDWDTVARKIEEIKSKCPSFTQVALIGHSRGGIISSIMLQQRSDIKQAISIGEVSYRNTIESMDPHVRNRLYEITGKHDVLVTQSSFLPADHKKEVNVGHLGLLYSSEVHRQVVQWLNQSA